MYQGNLSARQLCFYVIQRWFIILLDKEEMKIKRQ